MRSLIKDYIKDYFPSNDNDWIEQVYSKRTLMEQVETAVLSLNAYGVMHGHQRRVGIKRLKKFAQSLLSGDCIHQLKRALRSRNFHNVYLIVKRETKNHYMVGSLTAYDTAQRICSVYGIEPEYVYLHTGTTVGAKNLGINTRGKEYLEMSEIPSWITLSLSAADIENFFCIYKDNFKATALKRGRRKSC